MTRKARNSIMYSRHCDHYVAKNAEYRPDSNPRSYPTIPESYPKITGMGPGRHGRSNARYPEDLVDSYGDKGIMGPRVRRISPSYLDRVLRGKSTVASRQRYIRRIIDNPRSPTENVGVAVRYVRDNPYMFIPEAQCLAYGDDINRTIAMRNGPDAESSFVSRLSAMFPRVWSR